MIAVKECKSFIINYLKLIKYGVGNALLIPVIVYFSMIMAHPMRGPELPDGWVV